MILDFLRRLKKGEAGIGVSYISGKIMQGKISITWKGLSELLLTPQHRGASPELMEVHDFLNEASTARGRAKIEVLAPLFSRLSKAKRRHLVSLIIGEVHQGAGEGLVKLAIDEFFKLSQDSLERAYLQKPDIAELFTFILEHGKTGLDNLGTRIFSPLKPMLAQIAESMDKVYEKYDDFALEHKLDGIRIQVHRKGDEVRIFSRHLKDITVHFPELVATAMELSVNEFILDGEAIGIDDKGRPVPFQVLARRTTRKKDIARMQKQVPVLPQFFDALYVDGNDLTGQTYTERGKVLGRIVRKKEYLAARTKPVSKSAAIAFYEQAIECGNEGVMVKVLDSPYRPGKRGNLWFKIKGSHTADCVVLAAEWGHGRRHGLLSNLHLGILDETKTKYLMVGKTFKGLTDKMLQWVTNNLPQYKVHEDKWTVYVKPEVVVEIAFNEVQKSPKYDSGVALRFARVKRIRNDKTAKDINTIMDLEKLSRIALTDIQ
ncbi:ATP-dependent DNA ligase [candidate division WOR-3 bacterium]|nr:ATP-dependent DNA ligase [candidate division WOR-3 bacterium]